MNMIGGIGGASASSWASRASGPPDGAKRAQEHFARADVDGSGAVDASELQTVLDKLSEKTGSDLGSAADSLATMDGDGDGSLSSTELDSGIKNLLPQPASTVEFAQQRMSGPGGPGGSGGPPPPPPAEESDDSSSASVDALDTNGDGVVSAQERMAGELKEVLKAAVEAGDSDGDGALSSGEVDALSQQLGSTLQQMLVSGRASNDSGTSTSTSTGTSSDSGDQATSAQQDAVKQLAQLLLRQYAQPDWQSSSTFSVAA